MAPVVIQFVPAEGELLGFRYNVGLRYTGDYVKREARESEQALLKRALAIAEANHHAPVSPIVLIEDRAQ
jgi:hypothetical protein